MFGKRKRNGSADEFDPRDQFIPEGEYVPEEYADGYDPDGYPEDYPPEEYEGGYAPEEEPAGFVEEYADEYDPGEAAYSEPEKPQPRSIFRPATRKPNFIVSVLVNAVRVMIVIGLLAGVAGLGALAGIAKGYVDTSPELDLVALESPNQKTTFYDSNRNLLATYFGTENREVVSLEAIPKQLQDAFIAVEDIRFYQHNGIDLRRIGGALLSNLTTSGTQGGSTITQQLIKNTLLSSEQSYKRKIQEAWLAGWR